MKFQIIGYRSGGTFESQILRPEPANGVTVEAVCLVCSKPFEFIKGEKPVHQCDSNNETNA